jgi:hypothetical protein
VLWKKQRNILKDNEILKDIISFFSQVFEKKRGKYLYADYQTGWLEKIGLGKNAAQEASSARTTRLLQNFLKNKYGDRMKTEAAVAEGMTLRFESEDNILKQTKIKIDSSKLQAFDILDLETGSAYEISLSDAFAEFFKDVLKALLDSRVKKLYLCMRNHNYKGASKSGYLKVKDSAMVQQYISLAKLYKLDIYLVDIFPACNLQDAP